jgi:hypothetical protein
LTNDHGMAWHGMDGSQSKHSSEKIRALRELATTAPSVRKRRVRAYVTPKIRVRH